MATATTRGLLLIADISGFTEFVRDHAKSASHASQIVSRLLKAIMDESGSPLRVAELEGDAVFFYALGSEDELSTIGEQVKHQIPRFFRAFAKELKLLSTRPRCDCHACGSIGSLRLKQVVHVGEVAVEQIGRFEKLFGIDVIVIHRMLKNSLSATEYVMLSEPAFSTFDGFFDLEPESRMEMVDGVGEMAMKVFSAEQLAVLQDELDRTEGPTRSPTLSQIVRWKLSVKLHTFVDTVLRPRQYT